MHGKLTKSILVILLLLEVFMDMVYPEVSSLILNQIYRKSMISKEFWFDTPGNSNARQERLELSTWFRAVSYCKLVTWCTCACQYSGGTFIITDLFVTGAINDTRAGTLIQCQTVRESSIFPQTGMTSERTPHPSWGLELVSENIFDGVHGYERTECLFFGESTIGKQYFTVDLKLVYPIRKVTVMAQPQDNVLTERFLDVNVHVGNDSDYSNNPVLDNFKGPTTYTRQLVSFTTSTPLHGQFVSVVEEQIGAHGTYLCAMEIH